MDWDRSVDGGCVSVESDCADREIHWMGGRERQMGRRASIEKVAEKAEIWGA